MCSLAQLLETWLGKFLPNPWVGPVKSPPKLSDHCGWSHTVGEISVSIAVLLMKHKTPLKILFSARMSISLFKYEATIWQS